MRRWHYKAICQTHVISIYTLNHTFDNILSCLRSFRPAVSFYFLFSLIWLMLSSLILLGLHLLQRIREMKNDSLFEMSTTLPITDASNHWSI